MAEVGINEARAQLARLVARVEQGEEIVITRRGRPAARLAPVEAARPPRQPNLLKGKYALPESIFDPLPDEIIDAFYESRIFPDDE